MSKHKAQIAEDGECSESYLRNKRYGSR